MKTFKVILPKTIWKKQSLSVSSNRNLVSQWKHVTYIIKLSKLKIPVLLEILYSFNVLNHLIYIERFGIHKELNDTFC